MPSILKKVKNAAVSKVKGGVSKAKKVAKKVAYAGEVAGAGAHLAARMANPVNRAKMAVNYARGKGMVLPGSKYIGPGNEMNKGKPVDQADANAYQHDLDYDEYLKKGHKAKDVYTGYSDADERLWKNTKANTANGLAVNLGMGAKYLLNKTGLTKRIRDTDKPKPQPSIAAKGNPSAAGVRVRRMDNRRGMLTHKKQGMAAARGVMNSALLS